MRVKRYTKEYRLQIVQEWLSVQKSGMSLAAFAASNDIKPTTLGTWKNIYKDSILSESKESSFIQVQSPVDRPCFSLKNKVLSKDINIKFGPVEIECSANNIKAVLVAIKEINNI